MKFVKELEHMSIVYNAQVANHCPPSLLDKLPLLELSIIENSEENSWGIHLSPVNTEYLAFE